VIVQILLSAVHLIVNESQESVCATFGAGIAHGCVVDVGASKTSISCVEEGLVLPETRMSLNYGGDDISELYLCLLERINLPYRDADLSRTHDWHMMEDLKFRSASLAEVNTHFVGIVSLRDDR
jgi:actin-related protein 8